MASRLFAALRTALYAVGFLGLVGWLALGTRSFDPALGGRFPTWTPMAGILVMTVGWAIVLASIGSFVIAGRGTPAPFDPPRELVGVGPYRWVRNPLYVGALAVFVGFGLLDRSPAMLLFALALVGCFHVFVLVYEEPHLERTFGEPYRRYLREVPRWIPRRPRDRGLDSEAEVED